MWVVVLSAFVGGLILNLMPCVFPIISLKALSLLRDGGNPAGMRREGLAFFGGTLLAMVALAVLLIALRGAGVAVGWGFQLQSPGVVTLLALVMLAAALNLFGLFEVGIGLQRLGSRVDAGSGLWGAGLTGALAVLVATPCAGPFMAGAIGYALVQPPAVALAVFAALGAGVGAPFTLLSFIPAVARRLPRPGPWMGILKRVLAIPMLATAVWLGWVLYRQAGWSGLLRLLMCVLLLTGVCSLYGVWQRRRLLENPARAFQLGAVLGLLFILAILALPAHPWLGSGSWQSVAAVARQGAEAAEVTPIAWSPARVAQQQAAHRPVFVDFSAAWCLTCQVNEQAVLSTPAFQAALLKTGAVYMVADSTNYNAEIEQAMADLGRSGLPLYLVYPAAGGPPAILPQLLTHQVVLTALERAAAKTACVGRGC